MCWCHRRWISRRLQNLTGALVGFQQSLHALAKRSVAATGLIEVRCSLLGWQFHRRIKDGGFPLVRFAHGTIALRLPHKARFGKKKGQAIYDFGSIRLREEEEFSGVGKDLTKEFGSNHGWTRMNTDEEAIRRCAPIPSGRV